MKMREMKLDASPFTFDVGDRKTIEKYVQEFNVYRYKLDYLDILNSEDETIELELNILDTKIYLVIVKNDLRHPEYRNAENGVILPNVNGDIFQTYKGIVKGTEYKTRLLINEAGISGFFEFEGKRVLLEKPPKFGISSVEQNCMIVFFENEVKNPDGFSCGVSTNQEKIFIEELFKSAPTLKMRSGLCKFLKIATEADYAYFQIYGSSTNSEILGVINMIEDLYVLTYNVYPRVVFQNVWTVNDIYTGDPSTFIGGEILLNELKNYWNSNFNQISRDVVHLFTGVNPYIGGVVGMAFLGKICRFPSDSYSYTREWALPYRVTAHEIGHNLGGVHTDGINCGTSNSSIMCSQIINTNMYFSPASINTISSYISSYGSCLSPALYFKIQGQSNLCSSETYTIPDLMPGDTITWSVAPINAATMVSSGNSCTLTKNPSFNGDLTLYATINSSCGVFSIHKSIYAGLIINGEVDGFTELQVFEVGVFIVQNLNVPIQNVTNFSWFVIPPIGGGGAIYEIQPGVANAWFDTEGEHQIGVNIYNTCGHYTTPVFLINVYL